ncbi:MAG: isochorismate synthase [Leptolyngbyaceae cyanobacterium SM1_3_5]|nr:isochorismate synthase [Leptolyngbyaceae cyanobacterium SM1_3_5]
MNIWNQIVAAIQYISEGASHVFSLKHDDYPAVGVQPFDGEPFSNSKWVD